MFAREVLRWASANNLKECGKKVLLAEVGGRRVLLYGEPDIIDSLPKKFTLNVEEEKKIPLYQQAMDIQMGKAPRTHKTVMSCYYATVLYVSPVGAFPAWEVYM